MKKNLLRALEAVLFCAVLSGVLWALSGLMERKESRDQFGPFLKEPEQYDVLFFGDSCFVNCLFPMELWTDYGIAGYNLSCYGNTIPVSYWSLMNALDYANPKAVVFAVNDVRKDQKVTGSSGDLHTALDFWPLSRTKVRTIWDLTDDPDMKDDEGHRYAEMRWEYCFTLGKYHDRWSRLTPKDFSAQPGVQKGAEMRIGVAPAREYDIIDDDLYAEEQGAGYAYLRRAIEACQARGVEILLVYVPYPASEGSQMSANTVSSIAEEYGVNFIDFIRLDSVVDYAVDCYDGQAHLNLSGGLKVTDFIGAYLAEHYDLPDRRGDPAYAGWQEDERDYAAYKRALLLGQDKLPELLMMLHDDSVSVRIAIRAQAELYWDDQILTLLHNMARPHVLEAEAYSAWSNSMFPLTGLDEAVWADEAYFLALDRKDGTMAEAVGAEAEARAESEFGGWEEGKEIWILLTDPATGERLAERQF